MPARELIAEIRKLKKLKSKYNYNDDMNAILDKMIADAKKKLDEWDKFSYRYDLCFWCGEKTNEKCGLCLHCLKEE